VLLSMNERVDQGFTIKISKIVAMAGMLIDTPRLSRGKRSIELVKRDVVCLRL